MLKIYKHAIEGYTGPIVEANDKSWISVAPDATPKMVIELMYVNIGDELLIEDEAGNRFVVTPGPVN